MTASILDGKSLAASIRADIKEAVSTRIQQGKPAPGLAVVIVGNDPASTIYVANKRRACLEVGFNSFDYNLACDVSEQEL